MPKININQIDFLLNEIASFKKIKSINRKNSIIDIILKLNNIFNYYVKENIFIPSSSRAGYQYHYFNEKGEIIKGYNGLLNIYKLLFSNLNENEMNDLLKIKLITYNEGYKGYKYSFNDHNIKNNNLSVYFQGDIKTLFD